MATITEKSNFLDAIKNAFDQRGLEPGDKAGQAFDLFMARGLPTAKSESYRLVPITRILEKAFSEEVNAPSEQTNLSLFRSIHEQPSNKVVFVNGAYDAARSEILDKSISLALEQPPAPSNEQDPFELLNLAFCNTIVDIRVADSTIPKYPLAIIHYFDSPTIVFANPRWQCTVGANSELTISEHTVTTETASYFNNKQSRLVANENAKVEFVTIQQGAEREILVNNVFVDIAKNSKLRCYTFTFKGLLVRNNLTIAIHGENIDARLNGLYLLSGHTFADNHTVVDHRKPRSFSNEIYKGVMDGNSKAVFNGKIFVQPDAQKTNAFQSNRNILLSESSSVHAKPQLEIWADDVKCSHGCTTGQLDEEALFYLRSRGLSKEMSRGMLLKAFAAETLEGITSEPIKDLVNQLISKQLHQSP